MGFFRKKNKRADADVTMEEEDFDEDDNGSVSVSVSVPKEVLTGSSSRRSLSKWLSGGSSKKLSKKDKDKNKKSSSKSISNKISYSTSTSASLPEDDNKQDQDQDGIGISPMQSKIDNAATFTSTGATERQQQENDLANSLCSLPPPAFMSAFDGPPRFDWIDIEYSAATKIQSIFRRHLVLHAMEEQGLSTSYIRNRKRQRKANKPLFFHTSKVDEAAPDLGFGCCSVGLAFGGGNDFDDADTAAYRNFQRKQYEEKLKAQKEREESVSQRYLEQKGMMGSVQQLEQCKSREELFVR